MIPVTNAAYESRKADPIACGSLFSPSLDQTAHPILLTHDPNEGGRIETRARIDLRI